MNKSLIFLLLPTLLWAQTETKLGSAVTVKRAEAVQQPAGTVDRVLKRTAESVTYQDSAHFARGDFDHGTFLTVIGNSPVHFNNAGVMERIDLTERAARTAGYQRSVNIGPSTFEYDSTGRLRYEKGGLWFEVWLATKGVGIEFLFNTVQLKANYTLTTEAQRHVAWGLKDPDGIAKRKVQPFTATDADGKPVAVTTKWLADSLLVDIGVGKLPILLDPTINDTIIAATSGCMLNGNYAIFNQSRDSTSGIVATAGTYNAGLQWYTAGSYWQVQRLALSFKMSTMPYVSAVDSAKLFGIISSAPADTSRLIIARGTFTGTLGVTWFNDFTGWAAGPGAYTLTEYNDTPWLKVAPGASGTISTLFNAAGRDTLKAKMGSADTLCLMLIEEKDKTSTASPTTDKRVVFSNLYLGIYYTAASQLGLSTPVDSQRVSAVLWATIDSTGGQNATVRGFKYWLQGTSDTLTKSKSGSFGTGAFTDTVYNLKQDSTYFYIGFAQNVVGTSQTAADSVSTRMPTGGASTSVYVDGRKVSIVR